MTDPTPMPTEAVGDRALAGRIAQAGMVTFWLAVAGLGVYTDLGMLDVILLSVLLVAVPTLFVHGALSSWVDRIVDRLERVARDFPALLVEAPPRD